MRLDFSKKTYFLIYIFLAASSILLGVLLWNKNGFMEDSFEYLKGAETLIEQGKYLSMYGGPNVVFPPGYSFFIVLFYLILGDAILSAKLVSLIASTVSVCLTFKLGKALFNPLSSSC
jgi:4-amino-4-deoxy-L-arabinose transferase-like glycosyltransferase